MLPDKNFLLFHPHFVRRLMGSPLVVVDIGARGRLDPPWTMMDLSILQIVGFEPDPEGYQALVREGNSGATYYPVAVSNRKGRFPFYINENAYTSSIYPPNTALIEKYSKQHWKTRRPVQKTELEFDTLDNVLTRSPDFIKIDTQGAEFPILEGAGKNLRKCFGVLLETWLQPVYDGLVTTDKIITFMRELGFELYDMNVAAAWRKQSSIPIKKAKRQIIGLDLLFYNDSPDRDMGSEDSVLKAAALAEIFGFRDQACVIVDRFGKKDPSAAGRIIEILRDNEAYESSAPYKLKRLIRKLSGKDSRRNPSLHY